jgi:hypothetical protein
VHDAEWLQMEKLGISNDVGFKNYFQPGNILPSEEMLDPDMPNNTKCDELTDTVSQGLWSQRSIFRSIHQLLRAVAQAIAYSFLDCEPEL